MKTIYINEKDCVRNWYLIDAADKPLGRVAAKAASFFARQKQGYVYSEMGDFLVIINAEKVAVSGMKFRDKMYYHHSGYVGGMKAHNFEKTIERHPEDPLMIAIKGMLPKGPLGRKMLKNVKVYAGSEHPHAAQHPQVLEI